MASNPACSRFERRLVRKAKKTDFFEFALFRVLIGPFIYYFNSTQTFSAFEIGTVIGDYIRAASAFILAGNGAWQKTKKGRPGHA